MTKSGSVMNWRTEIAGAVVLAVFALGWLDLFGPQYTWWALIVHFGS